MISKELLRRYLNGGCTEEETRQVQKYLTEDPEAYAALDEMLGDVWEQKPYEKVSEEETNLHLQKLRTTLYPQEEVKVKKMRTPLKKYIMYAAAAVLIGFSIPLYNWLQPAEVKGVAVAVQWDSMVNRSTASIQIELPDHSKAWISPNSRLYWKMPNQQQRMVKLEGEAFFDVAHNPASPFTVQTGAILTRVLGTAFNIEAYRREATVRVSLVRGKVAVQKATANDTTHETIETLTPGEMMTWQKNSGTVQKEALQQTDMQQWTSGYLVLNDVLLADVLDRMAARYRLTIMGSEAIKHSNKRVSTVFKEETPAQMLEILGFITGCKYRKNTNGIIEVF